VNLVLAMASGSLLILIFPRFSLTWLAPIALAPLLVACAREASWKQRFLLGWAGGFVFWFGVCSWIQFVLEVHGGLGRWGGWATFALFAILKGLHFAVFAALAGFLLGKPYAIPAVAALWTGLERTNGPFGFAWLDLGNAGIDMPAAMRLAPIFGVYGLSFLFAMLACAVALVILRRRRRDLLWLLPVPLILIALPSLPAPERGSERALLVQPNVDSEMQWTPQSLGEFELKLGALSQARNVGVIVWPEVPAPFYPSDRQFRDYASLIARRSQTYFLFGAVAYTPAQEPLNSAVMMNPDGKIMDRYDKIKLVPFGEFVPPPFGWVNRITKEIGDFVPGSRIVVFPIRDHRLSTFICYESAFPDLVRQFAHAGAEVLFNLSNDGYFGFSAAREQHLLLVRMRAAENRRWILRGTNDGITAAVDPAGRITERIPGFEELSSIMRYSYVTGETPYTRFGDWFAWGCLLFGLGAAAKVRLRG